MNRRPSGYEPDELPGCSTPHQNLLWLPLLWVRVPDTHPMAATLMKFLHQSEALEYRDAPGLRQHSAMEAGSVGFPVC